MGILGVQTIAHKIYIQYFPYTNGHGLVVRELY